MLMTASMASSDKPERVDRETKEKKHEEGDKDERKGGFMENIKGFIQDIGEKIEETIGFGKPTADVTGIHLPCINLERADVVVDVLVKNPNPIPFLGTKNNYSCHFFTRVLVSSIVASAATAVELPPLASAEVPPFIIAFGKFPNDAPKISFPSKGKENNLLHDSHQSTFGGLFLSFQEMAFDFLFQIQC
ncbi:hypothetical protein Vadar_003036 [Vaccinium darrowii]|uniref:Uncharacterized protein n=1 Tax=Vaccinium darrowii TaxID=229202 RepID=A0ACB7YTS5_9ERIC|nr:hypothetical protein Vadar_003036 [Vaccinium darrowii]